MRSVYRGDFDHLFRFTSPTSWREPQGHIDDCYFCLTKVKSYSLKWKVSIIYPNVSFVKEAAYDLKDSISENREKDLTTFFSSQDILIYCNDVYGLMRAIGHQHQPENWRLFIDSNKISLKAVLLHNENEYPPIRVAHATNMKECYAVMQLLLDKIDYKLHKWFICGDFKVIVILGLQSG